MDSAMRGEEESLANYHNVLLGKIPEHFNGNSKKTWTV